ncbi:hypothetical protein ACNOYE_19835 [Nannocystaceae bacterium ST9]
MTSALSNSPTARRSGRARRLGLAALLASASLLACSGTPASSRTHESREIVASTTTATLDSATDTDMTKLELDPLIDRALAEPESIPTIAAQLRERFGSAALDHLIARHRAEVVPAARHTAADQDWRALIDAVAQQRDAHFGGLYWHRDLAAAQEQAAVEGKPVLSLRLLGELTSEFSCANSRLFRTLLYADPELARWLDESFVLHWSSERPVPRVAIDFGDGRKLERTLTGNSAHFVLDAQGRTIDVIPGLYAPAAFREALGESLALHARLAQTAPAQWAELLAADHDRRFQAAVTRMSDELTLARGMPSDRAGVQAWLAAPPSEGQRVAAVQAVPMAIGKSRMEAPILLDSLDEFGGRGARRAPTPIREPDDLERMMIGARLTGAIVLHPNVWTIVAAERPVDALVPESERGAALRAMQQALLVALQQDTAKNALELAPRVHAELAARARGGGGLSLIEVDGWLYARLFETPASDPWLGLVDATVYTGLVDGGLAISP